MNAQERNWSTLFGNHTQEGISWYGTWTSYSFNKEVVNSLKCVRSFRANEDNTIIYHTNSYTYADGREEEKPGKLISKLVIKMMALFILHYLL